MGWRAGGRLWAGSCSWILSQVHDPGERHDLAGELPAKLREMLARWDELQETEVTIEESGLCPQDLGPGINVGGASTSPNRLASSATYPGS